MTNGRIPYQASSAIRAVIDRIGRTEDIKLSPDNRRLAVVDFLANQIFVFSIRIDTESAMPNIRIIDFFAVASSALAYPHGIAFMGNDHIIVCNRSRDVSIFRIPSATNGQHILDLKPLASINGKGVLFARVKSPGSVDCHQIAENCYRVFVCNNHWHIVTSHIIEIGTSVRVKNGGVLIEKGLKIPDGICVSPDQDWIAISNHVYGEVLMYRNTAELNRNTEPSARLRGLVCPHGVRFSPDGARVIVADAASQYLHVFESESGQWNGTRDASKSIRLLDDHSFYAARYDTREGGIKGVEIDKTNKVLITTRNHDVIAFYDLKKSLATPTEVNKSEVIELCRQRDKSLKRQKESILERRWNFRNRVLQALKSRRKLSRYMVRAQAIAESIFYFLRNRYSTESILDASGPAVSLTTHGGRLGKVHYAIESIGFGVKRPSRIILWLDDRTSNRNPPEALRRLESRGLEIKYAEDLGPHTKYYPYIEREQMLHAPLVTADDDVLYPRDWLMQLTTAYQLDPGAIHCHRAHRMRFENGRLVPYAEWGPCLTTTPSHWNFLTGVSGAIYPPDFLRYLKQQGRAFESCCPTADDVWIAVNAIRAGFKIAQVNKMPVHFRTVPGSQRQKLYDINVLAGGNHYQTMNTFSEADFAKLLAHPFSDIEEYGRQAAR